MKTSRLVVFHPRLRFDPSAADWRQDDFLARPTRFPDFDENGRPYGKLRRLFVPAEGRKISVFHEALRVPSSIFSGLPTFLQDTTSAARLREDEIGWYDTGFWAARSPAGHSIGLSEDGAFEWLRGRKEGVLVYVLSTGGEIIVVTVDAGHAEEFFEVDLYANNSFLPFAEARRMIHQGLARVGRVDTIGSASIALETLERDPPNSWHEPPILLVDPIGFVKAKATSTVRRETFYYCVALRGRIPGLPWVELSPVPYFLATMDEGYWVRDYFSPNYTYAPRQRSPLFLRTCIVVDVGLTVHDRPPRRRTL